MRTYLAFMLALVGVLGLTAVTGSAQTAEQLIASADAAIKAGKIDDAIRDATDAIKLDSKNGAAYRVRAQAHLTVVEKETKSAWLPALDKRFPRSAAADAAFSDLGKAIELNANDAAAYAQRGMLHYHLNDLDAAMADFVRANSIKTSDGWLTQMRLHIRLRQARQYAIAAGEKRNSAKRTTAAAEAENILRDAIVLHNKAIELDPSKESSFSDRAFTYEELGEWDEVIADLDEAIKLESKPEHLTYWRRGRAYHNLKRYADAINEYRTGLQVLEERGGDIELPQNDFRTDIAKNLALLGEFDEAFAMFSLALSITRPSYITQYERGKAFLLKGDRVKAEADFRKAYEMGRGWQLAADELRKMGKTP